MIHELKCWPEPFAAIDNGTKRHEVRKTDRTYAVGDILDLLEYDPDRCTYTGRRICASVTYISAGGTFGLADDICVMTLGVVSDKLHRNERGQVHVFQKCWTPRGEICSCEMGDDLDGCTS